MDSAAGPSWAAGVNTDRNEKGSRGEQPASPAAQAAVSLATAFAARFEQLRRIVAGMGLAAADADDVLQDVFVEASRRSGEMRDSGHAYRWLVRVTVNRATLEFRRRRRFERSAEQILRQEAARTGPASPEQLAIRQEEFEAVRRAMRNLEASLLVPLVLRYFSGMDSTQIGEALHMPAATVRSQLREARLILAEQLKRFEP